MNVDRSWEYINRSETHECGNQDWGRAVSFQGIYKSDFLCSVYTTFLEFNELYKLSVSILWGSKSLVENLNIPLPHSPRFHQQIHTKKPFYKHLGSFLTTIAFALGLYNLWWGGWRRSRSFSTIVLHDDSKRMMKSLSWAGSTAGRSSEGWSGSTEMHLCHCIN